jgi:hypothetical protein
LGLNANGISSTNDCKENDAPLLIEWLFSSIDIEEYLPVWFGLFSRLRDWLIEINLAKIKSINIHLNK